MSRPAVFLDRDGTINEEVGYIRDLEKLNLIPGAAEAIRGLNALGVPVFLATNQSGVARGYYPESWLGELHGRLTSLLEAEGAHLDALYYCPHLAEGSVPEFSIDCDCRKPMPGMLQQAAREHDIDLARSFMVGDKATDVEVGQQAGSKTILLTSGYGQRVLDGTYQHKVEPDYICDTLLEAYHKYMEPYFRSLLAESNL